MTIKKVIFFSTIMLAHVSSYSMDPHLADRESKQHAAGCSANGCRHGHPHEDAEIRASGKSQPEAHASEDTEKATRADADQALFNAINSDKSQKSKPKNQSINFKEKASDAIEDGITRGISTSIATVICKVIVSGIYYVWDGTKYVVKKVWSSEGERNDTEFQRKFEETIKRSSDLDKKITLNKAELAISLKEKEYEHLQQEVAALRARQRAQEQARQQAELRRATVAAAAA